MGESWRLFIALELPEPVLEAIGRVQDRLQRTLPERAVRWVRPEGIHLTLKFLGDVPRDQVEAVRAGLASAASGQRELDLGVEGLGCFPNTRRPRVLWLGVTGDLRQLAALQDSVEQHIAPLGYPPEGRFSPHLTLGRMQRNARRDELEAVGQAVEKGLPGRLAGWHVCAISLMRSQLQPGGAVYTQLYEATLEP